MIILRNPLNDHGDLIGLEDDDHTQYHNDARGDARYYIKSEIDTISGSLQTNIDSKPDSAFGSGGLYPVWTLVRELWYNDPVQNNITSLTFDSTNNIIIAGTSPDAQIWVSIDGGDTWALKKDLSNETPSQIHISSLVFNPSKNRIIAGTYPDAQIWVSADDGDTWTLKKDLSNESLSQERIYSLVYCT